MLLTLLDAPRKRSVAVLAALAAIAGCSEPATVLELQGNTMGTQYGVQLHSAPANIDLEALQRDIDAVLDEVDALASTWRPDSALSVFNAGNAGEWQPVPEALCELVETALNLGEATDGAYDITVGPLVDLWGFGPGERIDRVPSAEYITSGLEIVGQSAIDADCARPALRKSRPGVRIDLSASAKGYAVDRVAMVLDGHRLGNYIVDIGGELRMRGWNRDGEKYRIAIESPVPGVPHVVVQVSDVAIATSGDYRNYFDADGRRYSHAIDPRTGYPATHDLASVAVLAASAHEADGLATALLVMGAEEGLCWAERHNVAALFQRIEYSHVVRSSTTAFDALAR